MSVFWSVTTNSDWSSWSSPSLPTLVFTLTDHVGRNVGWPVWKIARINPITVELHVKDRQVPTEHLKLDIVPQGGKIEIVFLLEGDEPERPFIAWFSGDVQATSYQNHAIKAVGHLQAFV
jgi:hypothetical protein